MEKKKALKFGRRSALKVGAASVGSMISAPLLASPAAVDASIAALFGGRVVQPGKVSIKIPPITENGTSVSFSVDVDSPMTPEDHVVRIAVFAEENPVPDIARYELGPRAGIARVESRIRMNGSQRIRAVAEMNDGSLWSGYAFSIVTLAACLL